LRSFLVNLRPNEPHHRRFARLKKAGKKGFIVYIGAGDPISRPRANSRWLSTRRASMCSNWASRSATLWLTASSTNSPRSADWNPVPRRPKFWKPSSHPQRFQIPVVFYIYFNLLHRYGFKKFIDDAASAGVDGLLVLDLPPEESGNYEALMRDAGLCVIYLIAPPPRTNASN